MVIVTVPSTALPPLSAEILINSSVKKRLHFWRHGWCGAYGTTGVLILKREMEGGRKEGREKDEEKESEREMTEHNK